MPSHLDSVRNFLEGREEYLSPFASRSVLSRGRLLVESPSPVRLEYQRDRDRIIHCNSFRRLKHKTQVFVAPIGDHYVTRLTHTLEVSQIARTISRALNLNEDLTEAIALGHDLGHTPFGHIGEEVLNELHPSGFRHNEQSLRIVDCLENNGKGLNLTWEVRDGILNHSKTRVIEIMGDNWGKVGTLEGEICKISDIVAYINHDIDDAVRSGLLREEDLPRDSTRLLGNSRSERINTLICDIVENSWNARGEDVTHTPAINMSDDIRQATFLMLRFLHERVYTVTSQQKEAEDARKIVRFLYDFFNLHPGLLPPEYNSFQSEPAQNVTDYIAGMTDQYAQRKARELGSG
ncbi:MAG: deoxyguanosinetriphosphate triphosphohydrolase [Dehalococcoidales bacterium]|nr:deoxyguanosinetriphosphate triphosphohydrolase [Dehalococcoidales bacterium]